MNKLVRLILISFLLLSLVCRLDAQTVDVPKLKEIKGKKLLEDIRPLQHKKGLWGYANKEGKFVIKPVFTQACPFEGKLARVNVEGKWGLISDNGTFILPPIYDNIDGYSSDSLAVVKSWASFGLLDAKGHLVQPIVYEDIQYADYGYRAVLDDKFGTIDKNGQEILSAQYDNIVMLDRRRGLEMVFKDGLWGVLRNGRDVLAFGFDEQMVLLQSGSSGQPDLYLVHQNGKTGVVTSYGQFVVPCVYDDIIPALSGQYYLTVLDGKFGAVSLKMVELIPPILEKRPYLGEEIFKVHDNGTFSAVNCRGTVSFEDCADLYYAFKPDDYAETTSIPAWSKNAIIDENLLNRQTQMENARLLAEVMGMYGFDPAKAQTDPRLPQGMTLFVPSNEKQKYGIAESGSFSRSSGVVTDYESGHHNLLYRAVTPSGADVRLVSVPSTGEYLVAVDRDMIPLRKAVEKFNIKEFAGIYPKDFSLLPDDRLMVRFAFIRSAYQISDKLVETDPDYLPVPSFPITVHNGTSRISSEIHAVMTFSLDSLAPLTFVQLPLAREDRMSGSVFGGFFTHSSGPVLVDENNSLRRFDINGQFDWEYRPRNGEVFYDIEETENYIYLCGSTKNSVHSGIEVPFIVQLSKRGVKEKEFFKDYPNARYTGILCLDHLIYAKTASLKNKVIGTDFYPHYALEEFGDNFGVRHKCVWEPWGDAMVGGCGLISYDGKWLNAPVLKSDQMCTSFDWEFGGFSGAYLIVRHMGAFGLVNKAGELVVEPKYDLLEMLDNPAYVKVKKGDYYGVIDVTGKLIVPVEYDYVGRMSEDIIVVRKGNVYGCFDKNGTTVVPLQYDEIREFVGGMARIRIYGKFGFINTSGAVVVAPFSDEVENFSEGCCLVTMRNKVGLVNMEGDWIAAPMYDSGGSFFAGYAYLAKNGKYGYIDKSGEFVIPMKYSDARDFDPINNLAAVAEDAKWGVIDINGNYIVPAVYDNVTICGDGYICVGKDSRYGIYTPDGRELYPVECDAIECDEHSPLFRYEVASARLNDQRIRIDKQGNVIYQYSLITD